METEVEKKRRRRTRRGPSAIGFEALEERGKLVRPFDQRFTGSNFRLYTTLNAVR